MSGEDPNHELPPPILIEDAASFGRLAEVMAREGEIAVDTEADSFFSYREKVCLIQVTAGNEDYLIDPLAGFDLSALGEVLGDPDKIKVFHDGEYDILILKRLYDFRFENLFDTRVAAATLGSKSPGLASVLREHFGVQLDKAMQRSNWSKRPLTSEQVAYARLDTHFLLPLMHEQKQKLEAEDRTMIVSGECRRLEALEPVSVGFDADEFVRIKGARTLAPEERQVLRELYKLREGKAEARDLPPFRIINNEVMLLIARRQPKTIDELDHVRGFSPRQLKRYGDEVLEAVKRAEELGPLQRVPSLPSRDGTSRLTDEAFELHERLKQWRKEIGNKMGVESGYLVNRHILLQLAKTRPQDEGGLVDPGGLQPWQVERFGETILGVIARFEKELSHGKIDLNRRRGGRPSRG